MKRYYELTDETVNTILGALSELPFKVANQIILDILGQHNASVKLAETIQVPEESTQVQ